MYREICTFTARAGNGAVPWQICTAIESEEVHACPTCSLYVCRLYTTGLTETSIKKRRVPKTFVVYMQRPTWRTDSNQASRELASTAMPIKRQDIDLQTLVDTLVLIYTRLHTCTWSCVYILLITSSSLHAHQYRRPGRYLCLARAFGEGGWSLGAD